MFKQMKISWAQSQIDRARERYSFAMLNGDFEEAGLHAETEVVWHRRLSQLQGRANHPSAQNEVVTEAPTVPWSHDKDYQFWYDKRDYDEETPIYEALSLTERYEDIGDDLDRLANCRQGL